MKKRSKRQIREGIQSLLEKRRRFDYDYIPFGDNYKMPDKNFAYRAKGANLIITMIVRFILSTLGALLVKVCYGAKVVGKENLKSLKNTGYVSVMNHFHFLDTVFLRQAIGHFRSYHTMTAYNNKTGFLGFLIRHAGMLPFSGVLAAMKNFNAETERLLKEGKAVNFYAEKALWGNYRKPRPMKDGAFKFAVQNGVPVLPVFCTFDKSKKYGHIRKLKIHILPAVYPDAELPKSLRISDMRERAEREWKETYEKAYGIPLVYESEA